VVFTLDTSHQLQPPCNSPDRLTTQSGISDQIFLSDSADAPHPTPHHPILHHPTPPARLPASTLTPSRPCLASPYLGLQVVSSVDRPQWDPAHWQSSHLRRSSRTYKAAPVRHQGKQLLLANPVSCDSGLRAAGLQAAGWLLYQCLHGWQRANKG
jgi:hypothetical protein